MKIEERKIPVREMFDGYVDSAEPGVKAYGGRLNVRPAYQREFVYNPQQRDAVIRTVRNGFPLNVMYWVKNGEGGYEMLDGQQRTISICRYLNGSAIRQQILETVLGWIADRAGGEIEDYMSAHQNDCDCIDLWEYFQSVVKWVKETFPVVRAKLMKGLPWGIYFNKYGKAKRDSSALEAKISQLLRDDEDVGDITNQRGIYEYLLSGDERHLSIRRFSDKMARTAYERQKGTCPICHKHFAIEEMQADHIVPWSKGGHTVASNCQMLCADCNRRKGDR